MNDPCISMGEAGRNLITRMMCYFHFCANNLLIGVPIQPYNTSNSKQWLVCGEIREGSICYLFARFALCLAEWNKWAVPMLSPAAVTRRYLNSPIL